MRRSLRLRTNGTGHLVDPRLGDANRQTKGAKTAGATASCRRNLRLLFLLDAALGLRSGALELRADATNVGECVAREAERPSEPGR